MGAISAIQDITQGGFSAQALGDLSAPGQSGVHIMSSFANILPVAKVVRASGKRINLLCDSMGNWALHAAVESWFSHGQGPAALFDTAILAAADEVYNSFGYTPPGRLSRLQDLVKAIRIYYSEDDGVLQLSNAVNGVPRLGQDGPQNKTDPGEFPPALYSTVDCSDFKDYDINFASSHQYYRRSPSVRDDIKAVL